MTDVSRLIKKLLIFFAPIAVAYGLMIGYAFRIGEAMPVAEIVHIQQEQAGLIYNPYLRTNLMPYKIYGANTHQPEILVMGSSRTEMLRSEFFAKRPTAFYNAGTYDWDFRRAFSVLALLDEGVPKKILLIELDIPMFLDSWDGSSEVMTLSSGDSTNIDTLVQGTNETLRWLVRNPSLLVTSWNRKSSAYDGAALGLQAINTSSGFRWDGSMQHNRLIHDGANIQAAFEASTAAFDTHAHPYVRGGKIDAKTIAILDKLLSFAQAQHITVVGFTASYAHTFWDKMATDPDFAYLHEIPAVFEQKFKGHGFHYFNWSDPSSLQLSDDDFYDGWHSSERTYARIVVAMQNALPEVFSDYVDVQALTAVIERSTNPWDIFGHN